MMPLRSSSPTSAVRRKHCLKRFALLCIAVVVVGCGSSSGPSVNITGTYLGTLSAGGRSVPLTVQVAQSGSAVTGTYIAANGFDSGQLSGQFVDDFLIRGTATSARLRAADCPLEAVTRGFVGTITQLTGTISCPGVTGVATFHVSR